MERRAGSGIPRWLSGLRLEVGVGAGRRSRSATRHHGRHPFRPAVGGPCDFLSGRQSGARRFADACQHGQILLSILAADGAVQFLAVGGQDEVRGPTIDSESLCQLGLIVHLDLHGNELRTDGLLHIRTTQHIPFDAHAGRAIVVPEVDQDEFSFGGGLGQGGVEVVEPGELSRCDGRVAWGGCLSRDPTWIPQSHERNATHHQTSNQGTHDCTQRSRYGRPVYGNAPPWLCFRYRKVDWRDWRNFCGFSDSASVAGRNGLDTSPDPLVTFFPFIA